MTTTSNIPTRQVLVDDESFTVPRGIGRNKRNRAWQVKVARKGEVVLSGNFADDQYESTQGALSAAISLLQSSDVAQDTRSSLRLSERVNLMWVTSGPGVIALVAAVYSPHAKQASNVYLISKGKARTGKTEGLKEKILKALERSWKQDNDRQTVPMAELMRIRQEVEELMVSDRFKELLTAAPEAKVRDQ